MKLLKRIRRDDIEKLVFVSIAIAFALTRFFDMTWADAVMYSPAVLAGLALSIFALTQVLAVALFILDEVGPSLGMRRSPLA